MKESKMADLIIDSLSLSKVSRDAQALKNWTKSDKKGIVDFADVAYFVIREREQVQRSTLSIDEINDLLNRLNASQGSEEKRRLFVEVFSKVAAEEAKWLIRIILKEMKLGISEQLILKLYHPDAMDLYNVCADLRHVCTECRYDSKREDAVVLIT